jgi:hypothetical protein
MSIFVVLLANHLANSFSNFANQRNLLVVGLLRRLPAPQPIPHLCAVVFVVQDYAGVLSDSVASGATGYSRISGWH